MRGHVSTGISRHTIRAGAKRFEAQGDPPPPSPDDSNCPGVATDLVVPLASQTAPPRPPASLLAPAPAATSLCEPHRAFIEAQLRLGRNATAIYQDLVDAHGFAARYNSVKRFVARIRVREPEQFDRLSFLPGEEMQVDFGEGAPSDLLMVALSLAEEDMGWANWLDECWIHACREQRERKIDEIREDPYWVLIVADRGEDAVRFNWRIVGYREETAFLAKPLCLLSDSERRTLLA